MASFLAIWCCVVDVTAVFAVVYYALSIMYPNVVHFRQSGEDVPKLGLFDSLYFSLVTQSTIGYGAIVPVSRLAKAVVCLQVASVLAMFAYLATHTQALG